MTVNLLLAVLAIGMISTIMAITAHADSPLEQWKAGVPIEEIQCPESRILMESPHGWPACLTERGSAVLLERGFSIVEVRTETVSDEASIDDADMAESDVTAKTKSVDLIFPVDGAHKKSNTPRQMLDGQTDKITLSNYNVPRIERTFSLSDTSYWPKFNMTFPEYALVGEPFTVVYDYTYVIPDEDTGRYTHPEEQCHVDWCERYDDFHVTMPTYVDYQSEEAEYYTNSSDTWHIPIRNYITYYLDPPFDNTKPLQETFTFVINEPDIDYNHGKIIIRLAPSLQSFIHFYVDHDGRITLDDQFVQTAEGQAEAAKLTKKPPPPPVHVVIPEGPREGPPEELFDNAEHFLLRYYPDENYEELLQSWNMTQSWIDRFLDAKPNLRPQFFAPVLSWILPSAYGI